jgi:hypothetical protein
MRQVRPPVIGAASLPKRALSASATCPAGTIGGEAGVAVVCPSIGQSARGASTPPEPNGSPRVAGAGVSKLFEGAPENKEFCPAFCANAA